MQLVVIDKPYTFIPPRLSRCWLWLVRRLIPWQLRKDFGIKSNFGRETHLIASFGLMLAGCVL